MGQVDPVVPIPGRRNVLVTSALPYVNNVPHLGNLIGSVLSADVFARYCRLRGYNVIYMCGTDEYGTATETKAMDEKMTPQQICDKYHVLHKNIYEWFDIQFDKFGRTSTPQQTQICQAIFKKLHERGLLFEDTIEQLYCENCERFLADRFVEGTCPHEECRFTDARGDQCDKCGKLLNSTDLVDPRCKICRATPQPRKTDHLFLDLPKLEADLEKYVTSTSSSWSSNSIQTTNAWIRDGLKPRCITRDLKWGVPVPLEKFKDKVFYVWFDAPIGYISITANYTADWEKWWQSPDDVELFQFMGKDNVPFHTVIFPCTLIGTAQKWTLMRTLSVTEYLNYEDGKFSKSRKVGVFGDDAKDTDVSVEVWRYYLLQNRPEASDAVFAWADLQAKQNNELLKNLGNFIHRCLSFLAKPQGEGYASTVPDAPDAENHILSSKFGKEIEEQVSEYISCMEKVKLKNALKIAMKISSLGNEYLQECQFWRLYKEEPASCDAVLRTSVGVVKILATLFSPFMPSFTQKVMSQLNLPADSLSLSDEEFGKFKTPWLLIPAAHVIGKPEPIFSEMKDEEMLHYKQKFAGSQDDRAAAAAAAVAAAVDQPKVQAKKGGQSKKGEGKGKKGGLDAGPPSISRADIRVGEILSVKKHPDADSLYVEEIDVGEASPRTVVSGLVKFIPIEQMQNRRVCVVCNLKAAKLKGIKSEAMVLAASSDDGTKVELLEAPEGAVVGERLRVIGYEDGEADDVLRIKDWEIIQKQLKTSNELVACYNGTPFIAPSSVAYCTVASIRNGSIR